MTFDKFAWLAAVRGDGAFSSAGVKYVLQNIALVYLRHNGDSELYARQDTIAEELKVSVRLVKMAYAEARDRGYFVLATAKRSRGRGNYDRYLLQMPANCQPPLKGADPAPLTPLKGAGSASFEDVKGAESVQKRGTKCAEKGQKTKIKGEAQNAVTSENEEQAGKDKQVKKQEETSRGGSARVTAPAPPPDTAVTADLLPATQTNGPPSGLYTSLHAQVQELGRLPWCCPRHPFGTDKDCRSCKYFGLDFESSQTGLALIEDHAMKTTAARRRGKHLAPIAETAAITGRTVDEQQQRIARMLDGMAERNGRAVTGPDQKALDWMDLGRQEQR